MDGRSGTGSDPRPVLAAAGGRVPDPPPAGVPAPASAPSPGCAVTGSAAAALRACAAATPASRGTAGSGRPPSRFPEPQT